MTFPEVKVFLYWKQLGLQGLPCLETIEIRTQNLSTIIKNHKALRQREALVRITSLLARRGLVVLLSDLLFDRDLALTALRYLRHRGHQVIVLHLMDPAEVELSGPPEVRFRDPESPASVVVRPRELAREYRETVRREITAWRTACRRHGIAYHPVQTDMPFGVALRLLT